MKPLKNLFFIFLFFTINSFGQYTISGKVKDSIGVIEFANVIIKNSRDSIINGVITDIDGGFEINTDLSEAVVSIMYMGYKEWSKKIDVDKDINLGIINLITDPNELDQIILLSRKPKIERKVDRLIFNAENSITSLGGSGIDILRKTPGVRIDNDQISIIGKSSVRVLINDRLSPLSGEELQNYLRSLGSDAISKVEVITNPPAKYDAAGNSGLINIILKKVKNDFFGGNIKSTYIQTTYPIYQIGTNLTYQKKKWSVFLNADGGGGDYNINEKNTILYPNQIWNSNSNAKNNESYLFARAGIDYDITEKTSLGVQYVGLLKRPDQTERSTTEILNDSKIIDSTLVSDAILNKENYYHAINTHFKTEFDTIGTVLNVDIDYLFYNNDQDRITTTNTILPSGVERNGSTDQFINDSKSDIEAISSSLDFTKSTDFVDFELGGKYSFVKNTSSIGFSILEQNAIDPEANQSDIFDYQEHIQALYASLSKSFEKWNFKLGFRVEFTQTEGNSRSLLQKNENSYNKIFPTLYVTHNPNENHTISFNYGKRIDRPQYSSLNPFRFYSNPYSYTEGNPFLQPSFYDNLELSHLYKKNLNTSLYASINTDGSDQITFTQTTNNIQATVRQNFLNTYAYGLSQSYTLNLFNWLESYIQYDLNYSKIDSDLPNTISKQEGLNFYASIDNSLILNQKKSFLAELNYWYASPGVDGVDFISEISSLDLGLKCLLLNKNLTISLVAQDILRTRLTEIETTVGGVFQEYKNYYDSRRLNFTVSYRFGSSTLKNKSKKFSNDEERKRTY